MTTLAKYELIEALIERHIPLERRWLNIPEIRSAITKKISNVAETPDEDEISELAQELDHILCCGVDTSKFYDDNGSFNAVYWERINPIEQLLNDYYGNKMNY